MKHYETATREFERYTHTTCDGCGITGRYFIEVRISVHDGEEGGGTNELDYCDDCLIERADILRAAGSTAALITEVEE